jgi:hypothetical protein
MTQVTKAEPEALSRIDFGGKKMTRIPAIPRAEHAALVDAIRLNFPEIYDDRHHSVNREQQEVRSTSSAPFHPPPRT